MTYTNVEKKIVKHRLSTMQEWELIELLQSKQYKLTEIGFNNTNKFHQRLIDEASNILET